MTAEQILKQLSELRQELIDMINSPNPTPLSEMSELAVKISVLNEMLGEKVVVAKQKQLEAEEHWHNELYQEDENGKLPSITSIEREIRNKTRLDRARYDLLKMRHDDIWKVISMCQSHLSAEKNERSVNA